MQLYPNALDTNKLHFIGISGTAMASVATELAVAGFEVSGSDNAFYEPMGSFLRKFPITLFEGYSETNLPKNSKIVVGNAISRGNVELEYALDNSLSLISLTQLIRYRYLIGRKPIVITGTHGKTTTTALTAFVLEQCGQRPGWLVGGMPINLDVPCSLGSSKHFVIEGDEYDSVFWDKRPKFLNYAPHFATINAVEFDHGDIYDNLDQIKLQFRRLVNLLPKSGCLVINGDCANSVEVSQKAFCEVIRVGYSKSVDYKIVECIPLEKGTKVIFQHKGINAEFHTQLMGRHNALNVLMGLLLAEKSGVAWDDAVNAAVSFSGVKRRMERHVSANGCLVIDDFAHHPTAIKAMISTVREHYPAKRLWALIEPRSNTLVRNHFQEDLFDAVKEADFVVFGPIHRMNQIPSELRLDRDVICNRLISLGKSASYFDDFAVMFSELGKQLGEHDVVLMMSNGSWGGNSLD